MKKGFTLVEIMIVVAIIALLAAIAIPNLLRARVNAAEASARSTLRTLSTADESFASANNGSYAATGTALAPGGSTPPYINVNYCLGQYNNYAFNCNMTVGGYEVTATPTQLGGAGTTFTIRTGGVLTP